MKKLLFAITVFLLSASFTSAPMLSTSLVITVLDDLGTIQAGATVQLFETEKDYNDHINIIGPEVTDEKGKVKFSKLKPIDYYVQVENGNKNNMFGGEKTGKLVEGKINKVNIIISE